MFRHFIYIACLLLLQWHVVFAQSVVYKINPETGAIVDFHIDKDVRTMNWIIQTDGSQYPGITAKYGWGLGYFTEVNEKDKVKKTWSKPIRTNSEGTEVVYREGDLEIEIQRLLKNGELIENYVFRNVSEQKKTFSDIGIYTPFNDNYPSSRSSLSSRTHAHIWDGGNAAYVNATHMSGKGPFIGLSLLSGAIPSYDIFERDAIHYSSQARGVIALNLPDLMLEPNEKYQFSWKLFVHQGWDDFFAKIVNSGNIVVTSDRFTYQLGERVKFNIKGSKEILSTCKVKLNDRDVNVKSEGSSLKVDALLSDTGKNRLTITYGDNKTTYSDVMVFNNFNDLIKKRVNFIIDHQQMNDVKDRRYGAYMVFDNEKNAIYLNDTKNVNPPDRDEGAERLGMGVLLAKYYMQSKDEKTKQSLLRYAKFIRTKLQDQSYKTWSSVGKNGRNRGYNYIWVADFYFRMYEITKDKQFAKDGYGTLRSMFNQFGYGFYAIGYPIELSLHSLKEADLLFERKILLKDYLKLGEVYLKNGTNYPAHEVNYEQSIVAPAVTVLGQLYLETQDKRYLDAMGEHLRVLEAFGGQQPSFHLNEIAIRHWDDYWFGKSEMWGDTFPHYWSTLTASAFHYYYRCTNDDSYQKRAENIVQNNLCLFTEEGKGSCAYVYPNHVVGRKGKFFDAYANDQDWALCYYLDVIREN